MIIQIISTFFATVCIAVSLNITRKHILEAAVIGAVGRFIYLLTEQGGFGKIVSVFATALMVAILAHSFARRFKAPVLIYLVPGIITIVPGVEAYRMVLAIAGNTTQEAAFYFGQVIKIGGMIAMALFLVDTLFKIIAIYLGNFTDKT